MPRKKPLAETYALALFLIFGKKVSLGEIEALLDVGDRQLRGFLNYLLEKNWITVSTSRYGKYIEFQGQFIIDKINEINEIKKQTILKRILVNGFTKMENGEGEHLFLELIFERKIKVQGVSDATMDLVVAMNNTIPDVSLIPESERKYFYELRINGRRVWKLKIDGETIFVFWRP